MTPNRSRLAAVLGAACLAVPLAMAAPPTALADPVPTLAVVGSAAATTSSTSITLTPGKPTGDELTLIGVATQAWRKITVTATGYGPALTPLSSVVNAQGVERLDVFAVRSDDTSGTVTLQLPGNAGAASAIAVRVRGAKLGSLTAALSTPVAAQGPSTAMGDTADMSATVPAQNGDLAIGFGTHRLRGFTAPAGQSAIATNIARGSSGSRMSLSAWSDATHSGNSTRLGGPRSLSGPDDWAMIALTVHPAAVVKSPGSTVPAPTPGPPSSTQQRPYAADSPWNTAIPAGTQPLAESPGFIRELDKGPSLTSDPTLYSYPVYTATDATPRVGVKLSGYFSSYSSDTERSGAGRAPRIPDVPIPADALPSPGTDGSIIVIDPSTGSEWGFWQFRRTADGGYAATNGYRYPLSASGRFADGKAGRGAGLTYLGGLVRPWEIEQGRIDHALAMTYAFPSRRFVYPASKSDGLGTAGVDLPEGSRLQLDPSLTEADFDRLGLSPAARVMARALQTYGAYVVDNGNSTKVLVEDELTAHWDGQISRDSLSAIPLSAFRVVS